MYSGEKILDAGCGSGRDTKYFLSQGYQVVGFDASEEMVKLASRATDIKILHLTFQNINFVEEFDAVWASASLLHIPYDQTRNVYKKNLQRIKA